MEVGGGGQKTRDGGQGQGEQSASEVHLYLPALLKITIKYRVGNRVGELKKFFLLDLGGFAQGRERESPSSSSRSDCRSQHLAGVNRCVSERGRAGRVPWYNIDLSDYNSASKRVIKLRFVGVNDKQRNPIFRK